MMGPALPVLVVPTATVPAASLHAWADACRQALDRGARMVCLFGRPEGASGIATTAVLQEPEGQLRVLRGLAARDASFPSLTVHHPALQIFERELWEQTGLQPVGHPWLKPVRHEGARQQHLHEYPFFVLRGQQVHEVGVGPIHASVIEPGHFRFMCHGEQVHHLEIQLGYQHRGVEALLLQRSPLALAPLVETIVGDSSIAFVWGYCAAVEALCGAPVPLAVQQVRGVALELERVAMHLAALTGLATDIAFLQGGATLGRLRTAIINATMRVCGSRFGRGWLRPGGVRSGLTEERRRDLGGILVAFSRDFAQISALMRGARSVQSRFQGVGVLGAKVARDLGQVGLVARASGLAMDTRDSLPGALYSRHPVPVLTQSSGDCWARMQLRMREIEASVAWIHRVLQPLDADLAVPPPATLGPLAPDSLCVSVQEGFRGAVVQVLETDDSSRLRHYKVQDPSLLNWFGLAYAMRDNEISDFPICNKSFDLSYCGNDL
jgi:Ni,Fe-hydrogenase III large subunit